MLAVFGVTGQRPAAAGPDTSRLHDTTNAGMSLIGELRGYTFPVCPECGAWAVTHNKYICSDICGNCGWIADPEEFEGYR